MRVSSCKDCDHILALKRAFSVEMVESPGLEPGLTGSKPAFLPIGRTLTEKMGVGVEPTHQSFADFGLPTWQTH